MSHFAEIKVAFSQKEEKQLVAALELKFGKGNVDVHPEGAALHGYQNDDRSRLASTDPNYAPKCHIIIRKKHVGSAANDVGYRRTEDGRYCAYVSSYDSGHNYTKAHQNKVAQEYATRVAVKKLKAQGYQAKTVTNKDGTVRITATKYA